MRALWNALHGRNIRRVDLAAVAIIAAYALLALLVESGANIAGQGLDPVWAAAQQRGTLRVIVDYGVLPFTGIANDRPYGYDIDLARAVAQKLGLRAEFVPGTVDSIYEDLGSGKGDIAASALPYAPEQGWRVTFSEFYFNAGQVLVVPRGSQISDAGQLGGKRLGAPLGSDADSYARTLVRADASIHLSTIYDTPPEVLAALARGDLDAAIVDNVAALTEIGQGLQIKVATALTLEPYTLVMSNRAYELQNRVNVALAELRREGFFEQNGARWFR